MIVFFSSLTGLASGAGGTLTVDDADPGFVLTGSASDEPDGGYQDHFYYRSASSTASTFGRWTPTVGSTGLYTVAGFVPYSPFATATTAPVTIHAQGEIVGGAYDQSVIGGDFHEVFGGRSFKLVAGGVGFVEMSDASGESSDLYVGFDAFRFTRVGDAGTAGVGAGCATTPECADVLVCDAGLCREPCTVSGCAPSGSCDLSTGLCDVWPIEGTDTGPGADTNDTGGDPPLGGDGWPTESTVVPQAPQGGCGCGTTGGSPGWILLGLVAIGRRSRCQ